MQQQNSTSAAINRGEPQSADSGGGDRTWCLFAITARAARRKTPHSASRLRRRHGVGARRGGDQHSLLCESIAGLIPGEVASL